MQDRILADPFQTTGFPRRLADAARGLAWLVRTTPNARIHLAATLVAIGLGLWLRLDIAEWLWIAAAVGIVWIAEAFNSALETLANRVSPNGKPPSVMPRISPLARCSSRHLRQPPSVPSSSSRV